MTIYFIEKLENGDSTFRQRISEKEFKHNTDIYTVCANILYISKFQLFKTHPLRDWFCLLSQVDNRGGRGPLVVGPLERARLFR
jgi:hypothetical protein